MSDELWESAMREVADLTLSEQARMLGELAAWQHNKMMSTGVEGGTEHRRIRDAYERVETIVDVLGEAGRESFAAGFDDAIDFSLNADWRLSQTEG